MNLRETNKKNFYEGMRDGIPIAIAYLAVSFTLGIAARQMGISALEATVMSLTNSTSAGQFAALSAIATGTTYLELAVMQFVINLRYMLMSCSLSQKIDPDYSMIHRFLMGGGVTDEIFGISIARKGKLNPFYMYGAMILAVPSWALGTCLGVVLGNILPQAVIGALSVAIYGMFIAIIIPPAKENKVLATLIPIAMVCSYGFTKLPGLCRISSGMRVIILIVVLAGLAAIFFPIKEEAYE